MQTVKLNNYTFKLFCNKEHVRNNKTTKTNKQLKKLIVYERGE